MDKKTIKLIRKVVLILISLVVLGIVIWRANPVEFFTDDIKDVDLALLGLVIVLYLMNTMTKAIRWGILLNTHNKDIKLQQVIPIFLMGLFTNNITPGRVAGDPVRAAILSKKSSSRFGHGFSTVVIEKGVDFTVLTIYGLIGTIIILPMVRFAVGALMLVVLGGAMVFLLTFFVFMFSGKLMSKVIELARKHTPMPKKLKDKYGDKLLNMAFDFKNGSKIVSKSPKHFVASVGLTGIIWFNEFFRLWLILEAMHVDGVNLGTAMLASSMATLFGIFLPIGAGNSLVISAIYSQTGVAIEDATRAGVIMVGTSIWLSFILGIASMWLTFGFSKKKEQ